MKSSQIINKTLLRALYLQKALPINIFNLQQNQTFYFQYAVGIQLSFLFVMHYNPLFGDGFINLKTEFILTADTVRNDKFSQSK